MIRVAITGVGVISAIGKNAQEFWDSLQQGRSGIRPVQAPGCSGLRFANGAEVIDYNSADYSDEKQAQVMDRFAELAIIAAREAVRDSALEITPEIKAGGAVITGACIGGQNSQGKAIQAAYPHGGTPP